jgi:hypothetical protein
VRGAANLPSIQLAFSSLACTDLRDATPHLNQAQEQVCAQLMRVLGRCAQRYCSVAQPCDAQWRREVFPPGLLLAMLSVSPLLLLFAFAASRLLCPQSAADSALATLLRPLSRGYRTSYSAWEVVQYARRLLLALLIAFVPYQSPVRCVVYLPAC